MGLWGGANCSTVISHHGDLNIDAHHEDDLQHILRPGLVDAESYVDAWDLWQVVSAGASVLRPR
ncbi:hypothetical protein [Massilia sp.]|uniref:hypothetical protein n=1 Tax=Massilia sp. TaxID=1882437 RepID=UPI002899F15D|nr:hypothetical protein [Massilia sp.]